MSNPTSTKSYSPEDYFRIYNKKEKSLCPCTRNMVIRNRRYVIDGLYDMIKEVPTHSHLCNCQIEPEEFYEILKNSDGGSYLVTGHSMLLFLQRTFGTLLRDRILARCSIKKLSHENSSY